MKDYCECDAQLRAEKDLVVRVLSEEHSAESQEDEEQDHGYGHSHLDDVGCTEDRVHAGLDSHLMILMEVESQPEEACGHTMPRGVPKVLPALLRMNFVRHPEGSGLSI
jgi:hypothetical protein